MSSGRLQPVWGWRSCRGMYWVMSWRTAYLRQFRLQVANLIVVCIWSAIRTAIYPAQHRLLLSFCNDWGPPCPAADPVLVWPDGLLHRHLGLLRSAPAAGALGMSLWLARRPLKGRVGRIMFHAVAVFVVATFWLLGFIEGNCMSFLPMAFKSAPDRVSP